MRPQVSARQRIFVVLPPRETPTACAHAPLFRRSGTMGFHMETIEHQFVGDRSGRSHLREYALPHATSSPASISVVDRLCGAVFRRHVAPSPTGFQDVQDAADDAPVMEGEAWTRARRAASSVGARPVPPRLRSTARRDRAWLRPCLGPTAEPNRPILTIV